MNEDEDEDKDVGMACMRSMDVGWSIGITRQDSELVCGNE